MVTDFPPDQRAPNSLSICSFSLIPFAIPSRLARPIAKYLYVHSGFRACQAIPEYRFTADGKPFGFQPDTSLDTPAGQRIQFAILKRNPVRAASRRRSVRVKTAISKKLLRQAQQLIPGGGNSPLRGVRAAGGGPRVLR